MAKRYRTRVVFLVSVAILYAVIGYRTLINWGRDDERASELYQDAMHQRAIGRLDDFEKKLLLAIDTSEHEQAIHYLSLGNHYLRTHKYNRAVKAYKKTIELSPSSEPGVLQNLAACYSETGDNKKAVKMLEELKNKYPSRFGRDAADLLASIESENNKSLIHGKRTAIIQFIPKTPLTSEPWIGGNWTTYGSQSDAYGYRYVPMGQKESGIYELKMKLDEKPDFPFQVIVKDKKGKLLGFTQFLFGKKAEISQTVRVDPIENQHLFGLFKKPKFQTVSKDKDGHKKLFIFWLDSGSWWFIRSLIERDAVPNFKDLLENGTYGQMNSDPPWTSIALHRLTAFKGENTWWQTFLTQLKGLEALDKYIHLDQNEENLLGARLAKAGFRYVSFTFNETYEYSPSDESSKYGFKQSDYTENRFDPTKTEVTANSMVSKYIQFNAIKAFANKQNEYGKWLLATQWDDTELKIQTALKVFHGKENPDAMMIRIPSLDILSHYYFDNSSQYSDDNFFLEAFYTYLDDKIGEIRATLDADDTLMVISDHGPLNHYQHCKPALFFAQGPLFPKGVAMQQFEIDRFPYIVQSTVVQEIFPKELKPFPELRPTSLAKWIAKLQGSQASTK